MNARVTDRPEGQDSGPTAVARSTKRPNGVLARPNLKLFVLFAVGVLLVQALIPNAQLPTQALAWHDASGQPLGLEQLLLQASERPCSELFTQISERYEKTGDYRRALQYLRMADQADSAADQ